MFIFDYFGHLIASLVATSITTLFLGIFVYTRNRNRKINKIFAFYSLSIAWWSYFQILHVSTLNFKTSLLWGRIEMMGVSFIPTLLLHFIFSLLGIDAKRKLLHFCYILSVLFTMLFLTSLMLTDVAFKFSKFMFANPGPLYHPFVLFFFAVTFYAHYLLLTEYRLSVGSRRNQMKYLYWSSLLGYLGGGANFLFAYNISIYPLNPFGTYFVAIYALVTAYAILRHRLMDMNIIVRKSLVYSALVALITVTYLLFVLMAEKLFQSFIGYNSIAAAMAAALAIALFFIPIKNKIQYFVDKYFFKGSQEDLARENERLMEEIRYSEKLKSVATLAAGMAHEIKNPLTSIKTFTEHLPERYGDEKFREKFQRIVGAEVEKINEIVQNVLNFAKPKSLNLKETDINKLLDDTLMLLNNELIKKRIELMKNYTPNGIILAADREQLKQVFLNLFLNSIEAMNNSGRLSVSTRLNGDTFCIEVSDTGKGISKKDLPRIFDPFYTTKENGTGLGLSVAYSIVKEHGGTLEAESEVGAGTTFSIKLPL